MKLYKYGMRSRGFSIGCQPPKVKYYEDADKIKSGYWSYIYYEEPLTEEQLKKYELDYLAYGVLFGGEE